MIIGFTKEFLTRTLKVPIIRNYANKLGCIQIMKFCSVEDSFKRIKRQATDGRKHLQHISLARYSYLKCKKNSYKSIRKRQNKIFK